MAQHFLLSAAARTLSLKTIFAAWVGHDLLVHWRDAFGLKGVTLGGGVLNVAERGPSVDSADPEIADTRLDSIRGRTFFFSVGAGF